MNDAADTTGQWEGLYAYGGQQQHWPPTRFSALFQPPSSEGQFLGEITDGDGIGEASVQGSAEGRAIRFVKTYRWTRFRKPRPIHYEGTLSEDGLSLTGTWHIQGKILGIIPLRSEGTWRAQRPGLTEPPLVWPPPPQAV